MECIVGKPKFKDKEPRQWKKVAGWDAQQSAAGLPGVLNLAAASGMDLAQASDLVTKSNWSVMKKFIA